MSKLPAEKLASTSSFLGLMVSFAMPLGTALFSSLAIWSLPFSLGDLCHTRFHYPPLNYQIKNPPFGGLSLKTKLS